MRVETKLKNVIEAVFAAVPAILLVIFSALFRFGNQVTEVVPGQPGLDADLMLVLLAVGGLTGTTALCLCLYFSSWALIALRPGKVYALSISLVAGLAAVLAVQCWALYVLLNWGKWSGMVFFLPLLGPVALGVRDLVVLRKARLLRRQLIALRA